MIVIDNVKKLFGYNWPQTIKALLPNGKRAKMNDKSYKDLKSGSIIRIVAIVFAQVAIVAISMYTVKKTYSWLYGDEIMSYAFKVVIKENLIEWIKDIIINCWFPIMVLVYTRLMREKEQSTWPYFIVLIVALIYTISSCSDILDWISYIVASPVFALVGIISVLLTFLGNVNIAVGCIDFCKQTINTKEISTPEQTLGSYQPTQQQAYTMHSQTTINSVEKYCEQCGNKISADAHTCFMCGNKL